MTYTITYLQWKTPDDEQRNCPKHVEFYSKNKFEKLLHLVGFITRKNYFMIVECDVDIRVQLVYEWSVQAVNISKAMWQMVYLLTVCTAVQKS